MSPARGANRCLGTLLAVLALSGCTLGPDFTRPRAPTAQQYTVGREPQLSERSAGVAQSFAPGMAAPRWWQVYGSTDLDAWVEEALVDNPDLASSQAALRGAQEILRAQIGATELPFASLTAEQAHERAIGLPTFGPPTALYKLYVGVLNVGYDLDLFGSVRRGNEAGLAEVEMQAYELQAARQSLAANVVATAIRSAALKKEVDLTERLVELAKAQRDLTRERYALGALPHRDVLDAMRSYQNTAAGLPALRAEWLRTRHALAVLVGRTPENAPADLEFDALRLPPSIPVTLPSELVHSRPDILAAEASLHAANARVGVATANLYPQLQLSGSWGSESYQRSEFLRSPTTVWGIAAGLTEPLFAGGSLIGQERAANAQLEAARERYRATVLKAFQNVADVLRTLDEDATALAAREDALEAASHFYLETRARHALGAQTALAELSSEQSWQAERVNQLESAAARLVDSAALFEAVGAPEH